jgi:uncharacterized protein (TIGR02118 family)
MCAAMSDYITSTLGVCQYPEVDKAADPNAPFIAVVHLHFKSMEEFQNGFFPHAGEFTADMPNYTDLVPQVQISEIVK